MHTKIKGYNVRLKKHIKNVFRCIPDIQFKLLFHSHMSPYFDCFRYRNHSLTLFKTSCIRFNFLIYIISSPFIQSFTAFFHNDICYFLFRSSQLHKTILCFTIIIKSLKAWYFLIINVDFSLFCVIILLTVFIRFM